MQRIFMMQQDSSNVCTDEKPVGVVHYDAAIGSDYTLCGVGSEEDARYPDDYFTPTTKRVDCKDCIAIRNHVLGKSN